MSIEGRARCRAVLLALLPVCVAATLSAQSAAPWPDRFQIHWNEYNLGVTTLVVGASVLTDYASYNQDSASASQLDLERQGKIRDSRFLLSGMFRTKRPATWNSGIMYDWSTSKWLVRQTMISVAVPEALGVINVGRQKDGVSLNRIMIGYDGWTMERFTFSDAAIPLLADGVRYLGYSPKAHLLWNVGAFTDWLSKNETWSYYQHQVVGRLAYVRMDTDSSGDLFHLGAAVHVGTPRNDTLQLRGRPEVNAAPNFVDTGKFPATQGRIGGLEAYYRHNSLLFGSEYYGDWTTSAQTGNPAFNGGDATATWLITGETRSYATPSGVFQEITPKRPLFNGGTGAWEAVLRFSYINLNSDSLSGGRFWRITPMVNWYMNDNARVEFTYGYSNRYRSAVRGSTEFFQMRLQLKFSKLSASGD
jgi:phosphate-selective porin OprO/OprP